MSSVKVTIDNDDVYKENNIIDSNLLAEIGKDLVSFYKLHMRDGLDIHGEKFDDLKNGYRQKKGYKQLDYKVLIDSGKMWGSTRFEIDGNRLKIINDMEYSSYHNEGATYLPKREFIGESDITDKIVEETITRFLQK